MNLEKIQCHVCACILGKKETCICDSDNIIGKSWANLSGRYAAVVGPQRGDMGL